MVSGSAVTARIIRTANLLYLGRMYQLDKLTMRRMRPPIVSVFSKDRMPPSGCPSTINNVPCPVSPGGALNARDQSIEAPGKPSASSSSISRCCHASRIGTNCMPALLCVCGPPALVCVHCPTEAARPVIQGFGGLVRPHRDARQAVHTMAMPWVDGAGFGRHRAGEAQLAGDLGFPAAASARIAIRIGEMGDVRTEQSLEIDLVVGHLATSLPGSKKIDALQCYGTQWERAGKDWYGFLDESTRYYGRMVGVERAEGFISS